MSFYRQSPNVVRKVSHPDCKLYNPITVLIKCLSQLLLWYMKLWRKKNLWFIEIICIKLVYFSICILIWSWDCHSDIDILIVEPPGFPLWLGNWGSESAWEISGSFCSNDMFWKEKHFNNVTFWQFPWIWTKNGVLTLQSSLYWLFWRDLMFFMKLRKAFFVKFDQRKTGNFVFKLAGTLTIHIVWYINKDLACFYAIGPT